MTTISTTAASQNRLYFQVFTLLSAAGVLYFTVTVLLLDLFTPEFDPRTRFISEHVHSSYGYFLTSAFIGLGLGSLLLVVVLLGIKVSKGILWKTGVALLAIWGVGVVVDGIFPIDRGVEPVTSSGQIHLIAAMIAFLALMVASLILSLSFRKEASLKQVSRPALVLVGLIYFSFIISNLSNPALQGITQRLFVLFCLGWLLVVTLGVRFSKGKFTYPSQDYKL